MTTLVEFLRARLDEDEVVARAASRVRETQTGDGWTVTRGRHGLDRVVLSRRLDREVGDVIAEAAPHIARQDPARVLREVAAKRAIVEAARNYSPELHHGDNGEWAFGEVLKSLASVYSDHPDYRDEWR